ncbi:hypothetical protein IV203_025631 [Nitzschia inconspicua]|uniref:Uncharacterized protein n=1 Tax=Nitzschia inconspicua TaxID=303405 RepID=A0A9K3LHG5_9STRA|nr:hypothetical protein IV203_025631 [Nitzschia inconspicua]
MMMTIRMTLRNNNTDALRLLFLLLSVLVASEHQCRYQVDAFVTTTNNRPSGLETTHRTTTTAPFTFSSSTTSTTTTTSTSTTTTVLFAKSRKARRETKKQQSQGRSKQFYQALEEAGANVTPSINGSSEDKNDSTTTTATKENDQGQSPPPPRSGEDPAAQARRNAIQEEAEQRYQQRPEVSTMVVDEETGTEVLAQGQKVMDIVTRKAVRLDDTPQQRLAQMFPTVPTEVRNRYRFDGRTITVPQMVEQWKEACYVKLPDGTRGTPQHPSIAHKAIQFTVANRDYLGPRMKKTLARWTMHHATIGDWDGALEWKQIWDNYLLVENYISAPFRQIIQDSEGRVGPNFGNLDLMSFCQGDLYQRIGNYIVLKGMVAHWEKKVVDANFYEKNPQPEENYMRWLATGDPKRYRADPPILWTLAECAQVCAKAQEMCQLFVQNDELFADFPPEIVFLEQALKIKGGTALRKYMIEEFCPERNITPESLREAMRRFHHQLDTMQIDPYADLTNKVELLYRAMAIGTDEERDPYEKYLGMDAVTDPTNPAYFETYTFNAPPNSLVRFIDNQYPEREGFFEMVGPKPTKPEVEETTSTSSLNENPFVMDNPFDLSNLFGGGNDDGSSSSMNTNPLESFFDTLTGASNSREKQLRSEPNPDADQKPYETPEIRRMGRRHELGWLTKLSELDKTYKAPFGSVQPGRIIPDEEA